ncbi:hypothetical protein EYF80_057497 [Liparis tanakae]|uniref:Uncharacterized protein n=1 Tax=Liparis tanakae TaxID=230148 RepID=A0A4Z2EVT8_9TELE|nr:hypothetical protein EYF80_057497 [Liparis tanakae]
MSRGTKKRKDSPGSAKVIISAGGPEAVGSPAPRASSWISTLPSAATRPTCSFLMALSSAARGTGRVTLGRALSCSTSRMWRFTASTMSPGPPDEDEAGRAVGRRRPLLEPGRHLGLRSARRRGVGQEGHGHQDQQGGHDGSGDRKSLVGSRSGSGDRKSLVGSRSGSGDRKQLLNRSRSFCSRPQEV